MYSKNPLINLLKYAWHYSFNAKKRFVLLITFSVIGNIVWLLQPMVIGQIFNNIQFADQKNQLAFIAKGAGLLVLINVVGWIFHGTSRVLENKNAFLIRKNYRQEMFIRVMELPTAWHKDHHSGDTIDKVNKASERLFEFSSELFVVVQNTVGLVASIFILALYDVKPIVVVSFASVAAVAIIVMFDKRLLKNYYAINKAENFIAAGVYDYISNYITVISLRLKKQATREMENRSMKPFQVFNRSARINEAKWFSSSFIISVMTAVVIVLNAYSSYKTQGVIVIGTLFVLYQYLNKIGGSFYTFAWKYGDTVRQNAAVVAAEVIQAEYTKLHLEKKYPLPPDWKTVVIKGMSFSYKEEGSVESEKYTIDNVSLRIERGQRIALIGVSGSGKSTVLSLLRGLHEPDKAKVYCDGVELKNGLRHLHEYCTLIPQEPEIFNNTIEYNITLGVHFDKKQVAEVIRLANLRELVARLKSGLKTNVLEKGVSLSGGEKQRLALARGLLAAKSSQILLLDEPTSSVDVENELKIYENIFKAYGKKNVVSAVHSLHLLKYFDYIYMFKNSRIIGEGNFASMLSDPNFRILWESYQTEHKEKNEISPKE